MTQQVMAKWESESKPFLNSTFLLTSMKALPQRSRELFLLLHVLRCYIKLLFTMLTYHYIMSFSFKAFCLMLEKNLCNMPATPFLWVFVYPYAQFCHWQHFKKYFPWNISAVVTGDGVIMCMSSTACREFRWNLSPSLPITVPFTW